MQMNMQINNPNNQPLKLDVDGTVTNSNSNKINITLLPSQRLTIRDNTQDDLHGITITLQ
jgi:hypothetical protein